MIDFNNFKLSKGERLCHEPSIQALFKEGESVFAHPFKLTFKHKEAIDALPTQVLFSVSKRNFKLATDRNWVKRRLRELYRTHKRLFYNAEGLPALQHLAIVYVAKEKIDFNTLKKKWISVSKKIDFKK